MNITVFTSIMWQWSSARKSYNPHSIQAFSSCTFMPVSNADVLDDWVVLSSSDWVQRLAYMGSGVGGSGKMRVGVKAMMDESDSSVGKGWRFWLRNELDYPKKWHNYRGWHSEKGILQASKFESNIWSLKSDLNAMIWVGAYRCENIAIFRHLTSLRFTTRWGFLSDWHST